MSEPTEREARLARYAHAEGRAQRSPRGHPMTPAIAATFALAAWLADRVLGPKCDLCRERFRGWRTLLAHHHIDHADEPAGDRT